MPELNLEIITPAKLFFKGVIQSVTVPGTAGSFQVLLNHAPILSTLEVGEVKIELPDGSRKEYTIGGGTIEVENNRVLILADSIEAIDGIDMERAKEAAERARKRLATRSDQMIDVLRAENALKRATNRITAVEKKIRSEK
jgi:F-type H+-transporting ATPase subunit epsilon